jgi:protein-tyrosine phosphatase
LEKIIPHIVNFFFRKKTVPKNTLVTDMHSHLLAGLDDGVESEEEAFTLIRQFHDLGYRKLITTPHIMSDYYRNDAPAIQAKTDSLNAYLSKRGYEMTVLAAAEYYLDEDLMSKIQREETLLTMGSGYVLFETNFFNEPYQLNDFIFRLMTQGYKPVMAHPERYHYMTIDKAEDLRSRGVCLQLNIPSLAGAYGKPIYKMATRLVDQGLIDFLGSDCHNQNQLDQWKTASGNRYFIKALDLPLLNSSLL